VKKIHKADLSVVLCGCETWSLTLREEHRLQAFRNNVQKTFAFERDEVSRLLTLHNKDLWDIQLSFE